ncbi:FecR family protein [Mucilaginibacter paludis]|uniref:Anti-FecI sigma factor, FecR n=1 Tax=Mucilaginibacter paludis DSM 18603 TaxID=714943 RepID=H1Y879_9SPHI|nr:FecR family protein [Mucilaginibacter paludis]EHQ24898.1 anti-FecI sigma factor, FecR [Mucilaginibacter paludis DSM 18603]
MDDNEVKELLNRYRLGTATDEDKALLESWYLDFEEPGPEELSMDERLRAVNAAWQHINGDNIPVTKIGSWRTVAAVASILVFLLVGLIFLLINRNSTAGIDTAQLAHTKFDIAPGNNKATLTLANGKVINLSNNQSGVMINAASLVYNDGSKIDTSAKSNSSRDNENITLNTPKGGTYQLLMPDGTRVWLNAASSITFPSTFSGLKQRNVQLTGEAYFEVAKNKAVPFRVASTGQVVEVLGTHFDINTYADEPLAKTTLLEGSILLNKTLLKPGEQARVTPGGVKVVIANIDETMGWKNNYIVFEDEKIESVMRKIARWYNVEVIYEGDKPADDFGGRVSRGAYVSEVLKKLELTNKVHFKIAGRRIIVTK